MDALTAWVRAYWEWLMTQGQAGGNPQGQAPQGNGGGNARGNFATLSEPGAVAVTPPGLGGATTGARERVAKRVGRDISQSGITTIPNARESFSRENRGAFRRS